MDELRLAQLKKVWTILVAGMAVSVVIYGLLGNLMNGKVPVSPAAVMLRPFMYALACAGLVASVVWFFVKTSEVSPSPGVFQRNTLIALALAESASIDGLMLFFIGASLQEFYRFLGGSLFVMIFVILPRGLQHWAELEARERPQGG